MLEQIASVHRALHTPSDKTARVCVCVVLASACASRSTVIVVLVYFLSSFRSHLTVVQCRSIRVTFIFISLRHYLLWWAAIAAAASLPSWLGSLRFGNSFFFLSFFLFLDVLHAHCPRPTHKHIKEFFSLHSLSSLHFCWYFCHGLGCVCVRTVAIRLLYCHVTRLTVINIIRLKHLFCVQRSTHFSSWHSVITW